MIYRSSSARAKTSSKEIYRAARLPPGLPERDGGAMPGLQGLRRRRRPVRRRPRVGTRRHLSARLRPSVPACSSQAGERGVVEARLARASRTDPSADGRHRAEDPRGRTRRDRSRSDLSSRRLPPLLARSPLHVSVVHHGYDWLGRAREESQKGSLEQTHAARESPGCSERRHRSATSDGKKLMT